MKRQDKANDVFNTTSFLYGGNADYIDQLYALYEQDPSLVEEKWHDFFANLADDPSEIAKNAAGASWGFDRVGTESEKELLAAFDGNWDALESKVSSKLASKAQASVGPISDAALKLAISDSVRAFALVNAYRNYGHLYAKLDPLGLSVIEADKTRLSPASFGFLAADLDRPIFVDGLFGYEHISLRKLTTLLEEKYCGSIGFEYNYIKDMGELEWLRSQVEINRQALQLSNPAEKKEVLQKLVEAEGFEQFLDVKYKGAKRFGLDGGEAVIPALDQIVKAGAASGVKEVVLGMAHRGRLNVLSQIFGKEHKVIFHEFKGGWSAPSDTHAAGDVKYHLGASVDREIDGKKIHLSLTANPSHLEIVDPVVIGKARAKQDHLRKANLAASMETRSEVLPILLHGDAAFAGQGVVAELLNLSALDGYSVAGSLHIIINNQIGFTTNPKNSRSCTYSTDIAKMISAPVFHVNGDDVDAVMFVARLALAYRMKFCKPVVLDIYCYRRFGHNEGDEPGFTQPVMYKAIKAHKTTAQLYAEQLIAEKTLTEQEFAAAKQDWRRYLDEQLALSDNYVPNKVDWLEGAWAGLQAGSCSADCTSPDTGVPIKSLKELGKNLTKVPADFTVHRTAQRFLDNRAKVIESGENIDWATAEALAFGSLLLAGYPVRLSGQDVERGTFSQRHSVLTDQVTEKSYTPLNNLPEQSAYYEPVNSALSEEAVLGFEYGYSLAMPNGLTLWEAQFGDFANGAQVIFDQFLSCAESKWFRMSGLVCLLPHGYEGQGPEHSSARLERYLQLCAEDNMQVANCSTPANYFHILRRQLLRNFRKPLVLMTPKSLLRHKRAVSKLSELATDTSFQSILLDDAQMGGQQIKLATDGQIRRVVLCSGKVYYDLYEERERRGVDDVYLIRVEQLYPFPMRSLAAALSRFVNAEIVWCQEEPKNMGAWSFVAPYIEAVMEQVQAKHKRVRYVGRAAAASPATGLMSKHLEQLSAFLEEALGA